MWQVIAANPDKYRALARKQRLRDEMAADPFTFVNATHFSRATVEGQGSTSKGTDASSQHVDSSTLRRQYQMLAALKLLREAHPEVELSDVGICVRGVCRGLSREGATSTDNRSLWTCPLAEFALDVSLLEGELGFYACDPKYPNLNRCKVGKAVAVQTHRFTCACSPSSLRPPL